MQRRNGMTVFRLCLLIMCFSLACAVPQDRTAQLKPDPSLLYAAHGQPGAVQRRPRRTPTSLGNDSLLVVLVVVVLALALVVNASAPLSAPIGQKLTRHSSPRHGE